MFIRAGLPTRAEAKVLAHMHPSSVWFALPLRPVPTHAYSQSDARVTCWPTRPPSAQSPFACAGRYPHTGQSLRIASEDVTPPSSLLRAHASDQIPPPDSGVPCQRVFAGCCQSLLGDGPSRRYLCKSFLGCLDPYPVGSQRCTCPLLPSATSAFPPWDRGRRRETPLSDF